LFLDRFTVRLSIDGFPLWQKFYEDYAFTFPEDSSQDFLRRQYLLQYFRIWGSSIPPLQGQLFVFWCDACNSGFNAMTVWSKTFFPLL
jgi:hypothetical protein